jgi:hypothetical protein
MLSSSLLLKGIFPRFKKALASLRIEMRTYYFDRKDGARVRDRKGVEFPKAAGAIEHSKELAKRLRLDGRAKDPALLIIVVDESGTEVHREPVYPEQPNPGLSFGNTG